MERHYLYLSRLSGPQSLSPVTTSSAIWLAWATMCTHHRTVDSLGASCCSTDVLPNPVGSEEKTCWFTKTSQWCCSVFSFFFSCFSLDKMSCLLWHDIDKKKKKLLLLEHLWLVSLAAWLVNLVLPSLSSSEVFQLAAGLLSAYVTVRRKLIVSVESRKRLSGISARWMRKSSYLEFMLHGGYAKLFRGGWVNGESSEPFTFSQREKLVLQSLKSVCVIMIKTAHTTFNDGLGRGLTFSRASRQTSLMSPFFMYCRVFVTAALRWGRVCWRI